MATTDFQICGIETPDGVSLLFSFFYECIGHGKTVPVLSWAARNHYNFHIRFLLLFYLQMVLCTNFMAAFSTASYSSILALMMTNVF